MFAVGGLPALFIAYIRAVVKEPERWRKRREETGGWKARDSFFQLFYLPAGALHAFIPCLFFVGVGGGSFAVYWVWLAEQYRTECRGSALAFATCIGRFVAAGATFLVGFEISRYGVSDLERQPLSRCTRVKDEQEFRRSRARLHPHGVSTGGSRASRPVDDQDLRTARTSGNAGARRSHARRAQDGTAPVRMFGEQQSSQLASSASCGVAPSQSIAWRFVSAPITDGT